MKEKGSIYFLSVIMVIMVMVVVVSLRMEQFASKLLPIIISGVVFILAAIGLRREIFQQDKPGVNGMDEETVKGEKVTGELRSYLVSWAWVIGFVLAIYLLGFIIAIPLLIISYMKSHGTSWLTAGFFAVVTTALIYSLFALALRIELYRGILVEWLI